jgi:hypothetical protein
MAMGQMHQGEVSLMAQMHEALRCLGAVFSITTFIRALCTNKR